MQKETKAKSIIFFNQQKIRRQWDDEKELWYFSVVDVIGVLTGSVDPFAYWIKLKERLKNEGGNETVTKCHALKMLAADGKMRLTDTADTQTMLRLIQSIPSPNAEPLKLWLARVGYDRLEETADPELAINRALKTYLKKGYTSEWVNQRLKSIEIRKALTDEWEKRGVREGLEFADFLEGCEDVLSFAKNYFEIHFKIDYKNSDGSISYYYPDFFVKKDNKTVYVIETKGREDLEDQLKIDRLKQWCEDANKRQSKIQYRMLYVKQENFEKYKPKAFKQLIEVCG